MPKDDGSTDAIEITEAMIATGIKAYDLWDYADEPEMVVISIYRAMLGVKEACSLECPPPPAEAAGFVARELSRIGESLRDAALSPEKYERLYAAQQALAWALEPTGVASPYDLILGTKEDGEVKVIIARGLFLRR